MLEKNSDVYSFGVLMWELYRCMPPWVKTETGYTLNKRFRRFPVDTPRIYVALCARCLDSNPKHRPPFPIVLAEVESMHNAYLMGYDNLEEPPPSFVDLSEDAARGSAASGRNSPRLRTNSNQILPPSPKDKEDQASNGDAIKIPLPPSQEQLRRGVDEEVEVVAGEAGVVSTTKTSERVGQEPTLRSIVSINAQGRLTVEGGGDKGVMSQGVNPPPRSQAFVQYFTSKQIRELKKTKGSEEGGSSPSHHD